jgi:hypothetical protein
MSDNELCQSLRLATEQFYLSLDNLNRLALNAVKGAFA